MKHNREATLDPESDVYIWDPESYAEAIEEELGMR